jgi:hypothetical protein
MRLKPYVDGFLCGSALYLDERLVIDWATFARSSL